MLNALYYIHWVNACGDRLFVTGAIIRPVVGFSTLFLNIFFIKTNVLISRAWASIADFCYSVWVLWFYCSQIFDKYKACDFDGSWLMFFKRRAMCSKFDIYVSYRLTEARLAPLVE